MNNQIGIPGIVPNGVVVPQSSHPLPEGSHVEIKLEPGALELQTPASGRVRCSAWLGHCWFKS